jgi:hypothetical protein
MAGCSVGRGTAALNRARTLVRFQPGQLAPFGPASTCPWYGHVARLNTGEGLCANVPQWQSYCFPSRWRGSDSPRSLHADVAQWQRVTLPW